MVNRVVSTKLTEDEHAALLELCNYNGATPSSLLRAIVVEKIKEKDKVDTIEELLNKFPTKKTKNASGETRLDSQWNRMQKIRAEREC